MPVTRAYLRCLWHGGLCRVTPWYSLGWKHGEWTIWLRSTSSPWSRFGLPFPLQNTKMTWSNLMESEIFESTICWNCKYLENTANWKSQEAVRDSEYITWPREGDLDSVDLPGSSCAHTAPQYSWSPTLLHILWSSLKQRFQDPLPSASARQDNMPLYQLPKCTSHSWFQNHTLKAQPDILVSCTNVPDVEWSYPLSK